jgi:hypothetical protein
MIISKTATAQHGTAFRVVKGLTKEEKDYCKNGGVVIVRTNCLSGGNHGTYFRKVKVYNGNRFVPRTLTEKEEKEVAII